MKDKSSLRNATEVQFTKAQMVSGKTAPHRQLKTLAEGLAFPDGPAFASDGMPIPVK